jgi:Lrp/AsnC family transcriptional regulator for asnA, asnC and gidA
MQRYRLDQIDETLLSLLRIDGRTPFAELAHAVGLSPDAARARYTRLVTDGVLRVIGVVSPQSLGYGRLANVWMTYRGSMEELAKLAGAAQNITFMTELLGRQNVLVEVAARDDTEVADVVLTTFLRLPEISDVEIGSCLEFIKWDSQARPTTSGAERPPTEPPAPLSELDSALLRLLVDNPRASYRELAATLDEPYWMVRKRTQALFSQGTIRATAMIDRVSTEPATMAAILIRLGGPNPDDALRAIAKLDEVALLTTHTGAVHASAEVSCGSDSELGALGRRIGAIPGVVGVEVRPYVRTLIVPMPWSLQIKTDW